jgi:type 2 lantibiotic biosynthesis protein LanM
MRPSSRALIDSRGHEISDVFDEAPLDLAVRRVQAMDERGLRRQEWIIRASFATILMGNATGGLAETDPALPPLPFTGDDLTERAQRIGDRLIDLAVRMDDRAGWLGLDLAREREWSVIAASNLYSGSLGIALFLGYLGDATGKAAYTELASAAARTFLLGAPEIVAREGRVGVGAFGDLGGAVYALAHLGTLWRDDALLDEAERMARGIPRHLEPSRSYDVGEGAAGCALALLALHRARPSEVIRKVLRACGENLRSGAQPMPRGTGWKTTIASSAPLGGFSHGASGIALALLRMGDALDEPVYRALGRGGLAYEETLLDTGAGNWRDLRAVAGGVPADESLTAWCHGAAGVGLACLAALRCDEPGDRSTLEEHALVAAQRTEGRGFGMNHSLCHGDLGNVEVLFAARHLDGRRSEELFQARLGRICASLDAQGPRCGVPLGIETPSLFCGIAGVGWQLLRFAHPDRVPSVLTFDPPPPRA